jgi:hypothetical protein
MVIGGFDELFQIAHDLIELLGRAAPLFVIDLREGLVVVAAVF